MNEATKNQIRQIAASLSTAMLFGDKQEADQCKAVMAGVVATLATILPPQEFRALMSEWDINPIDLAELFELAGFDSGAGVPPASSKDIEI